MLSALLHKPTLCLLAASGALQLIAEIAPPELGGLSQYGAMGAMLSALFWLHWNSMKGFREELKAERALCATSWDKLSTTHSESMNTLASTFTKMHQELAEEIEGVHGRLDDLKVPRRPKKEKVDVQ